MVKERLLELRPPTFEIGPIRPIARLQPIRYKKYSCLRPHSMRKSQI